MKRLFDFLLSWCLLVLFLPLFVILALGIKLGSSGPVFYGQQRVGRDGVLFNILKFRSMVANADQIGPYYTDRYDKRVTKLGKFLRNASLDELPQLINVIKGDMSFIGPRPDVPEQRQNYSEAQWIKRHSVLPGITGLAQATLRSRATPAQRTALDLRYVDDRSLLLDIKILFMTLGLVLFKPDSCN